MGVLMDAARRESQLVIAPLPQRALIDDIIPIRLSGYTPHHTVTLRLRMRQDTDRIWESQATFVTDDDDRVDVTTATPVSGTYAGLDPAGLLWSAAPAGDGPQEESFPESILGPVTTTIEAEEEGRVPVSATVDRHFVAPEVLQVPVRVEGLRGTFFRPPGAGPHPCVLTLGGSSGGEVFALQTAALLASHGYASLSLAYFGQGDLPPALVNIPLEYFERAMIWLRQQEAVDGERMVVFGRSRGAELALLLGATFPRVRAVVAYALSSVLWAGFRDGQGVDEPSWSYGGQPLPYLYPRPSREQMATIFSQRPLAFTPIFSHGLQDHDAVEVAAIPVERIQGPVLLVSGENDQLWPSSLMSDQVVERLARHGHPYPSAHRHYPDAGHFLRPPHVPTTGLESGALALGGSSQGQAAANADAWVHVLTFLQTTCGTST